MSQAASRGARLVHFTEGAISGYPKSQITDWAAVDWTALRSELDDIARHARKLGLFVVLGSNHPLSPPNRPHNSLYIISDTGALIGRYDKRFCSNTEISDWYSPGFEATVFDVDGIRFGCALCIEVHFAELFDEYRRLGVDCMLLSSYSEDPIFEVTARAHASMNGYWLSHSVASNFERPLTSCVIGPDGHVIAKTETGQQGLAFATIAPDDEKWIIPLQRARPWRGRARTGDIYRVARVEDLRSTDKTTF